MHDVQTIGSRGVVAAMLVVLASPVMAQDPQPASTRATILDEARQALTSQSTPPTRSKVETGLYWYDNQYLLTKVLSGWKGIRASTVTRSRPRFRRPGCARRVPRSSG